MITKAILQNWLTTFFGILAGLPVIVTGSGLVLNPKWTHILLVIGGSGIVGLGVVAKAFNTHSTLAQAEAATAKVTGDPSAPVLAKLADQQAAGVVLKDEGMKAIPKT